MSYVVFAQVLLIGSPLLSFFEIKSRQLNLIIHFYFMNLALIVGFFRYLAGVKSSIWTPTVRNVKNK